MTVLVSGLVGPTALSIVRALGVVNFASVVCSFTRKIAVFCDPPVRQRRPLVRRRNRRKSHHGNQHCPWCVQPDWGVHDKCSGAHNVVSPTGTLEVLSPASADPGDVDGSLAAARFRGPMGAAYIPGATNDIIFVGDEGNSKIRRLVISGAVATAGLRVQGACLTSVWAQVPASRNRRRPLRLLLYRLPSLRR